MVYINTERTHDHVQKVVSLAREKIEFYEDMRGPFEDYCRQTGMSEDQIKAGLETISDLISYWINVEETSDK